jgi:hypothetical protein
VHASASPLEARVERSVWLGEALEDDVLAVAWAAAGLPAPMLARWCGNPRERVGGAAAAACVFDVVEGMDTSELLNLAANSPPVD